jgi:hypothetical protein
MVGELDKGVGQAGVLEVLRLRVRRVLLEALIERQLVKQLLEEYLLEKSPLINNYVKRIAQVTGLPEETVKRSRPVRNYIKKILGEEP